LQAPFFWFAGFFYKYQALVENKALKALGDIIKRDFSSLPQICFNSSDLGQTISNGLTP